MNKRIKELAREAGFDAVSMVAFDIGQDLEKFAELIARECANIVTDAVNHREPASTYADKIRQHFGVAE